MRLDQRLMEAGRDAFSRLLAVPAKQSNGRTSSEPGVTSGTASTPNGDEPPPSTAASYVSGGASSCMPSSSALNPTCEEDLRLRPDRPAPPPLWLVPAAARRSAVESEHAVASSCR